MVEKAFERPVQLVTLALAAIGVLTIIGALIARMLVDDTTRQRLAARARRREPIFLSR